MGLLDSINRVEQQGQMANSTSAPIPGRVLLADGDGLAYYCAGSEDTDPAQARINLIDKLQAAARACRAERTQVLLTLPGSHKGYRYAVARAKPYQGQRSGSRRPKNWQYLRDLLEAADHPSLPEVVPTATAEADDLFGKISQENGASNTVILTEDKDMRMVPGWHLGWRTHDLHYVEPGAWAVEREGKLYGRKWFWLQMLHGDTADNIPGLPGYFNEKDQIKPVGPVTAEKLLAGCTCNYDAYSLVREHYAAFYNGQVPGDTAMLEQAILLWMRNDKHSDWRNVYELGNPLGMPAPVEQEAHLEILRRVSFAVELQPATEAPPWND
jgi:DNA polymerase-1